ncbi:DUF1192 domain-containing protein [Hoeflea prorocentri]|uniref:DUF1192 domain-containing protein n=1 Tax=Hoeflea prorocentri TaxID=1922333 RepID=A0A9X3ZG15_9HYPH|nr:DUF1192 domain-containing protein [Hoeflea prorocentri]MCY6379289.1 DUF1192 domain-containing protein [Hoeflea prorocentri]MDA5397090.1 DUF1192 domain-containing protein [Hoeflea prorocentri]
MSIFEDEPQKKPLTHEIGCDLSMISVDELQERISMLQQEIERLETERSSKEKSKNAAESLFR